MTPADLATLSDSEVRQRLERRGYGVLAAYHLATRRNTDPEVASEVARIISR